MYGADALPLMLDQSVFSIRMRNTVRMVDDGCVVVVVLVVVVGGRVVVVVEAPGGVTVRLNVPCAPPYPSTTMKYACPAVTVGVMREARNRPLALAHASSLHPAAISGPFAQTPLRR